MLTVLKAIIGWIKHMSSLLLALLMGSGNSRRDTLIIVCPGSNEIVAANVTGGQRTILDSLSISGTPLYLAVDATNKDAYVVGSGSFFSSVDISDPSALSLSSAFSNAFMSGNSRGVVVNPSTGYVYNVEDGTTDRVNAWNATNPASISLGSSRTTGISAPRSIALDVAENVLYVGQNSEILSFDISTPGTLTPLDTLTVGNVNASLSLDTVNKVLYVASQVNDTLYSVDVSTPSSMSTLDSITNANMDSPSLVFYDSENDTVYLYANVDEILSSFDVSTPSAMSALDTLSLADCVGGALDAERGRLYLSDSTSNRVSVVDVSNPSSLSTLTALTGLSAPVGLGLLKS